MYDVLPSVLDFLKRCEHETFGQVMASVGGDLKSPVSNIMDKSTAKGI